MQHSHDVRTSKKKVKQTNQIESAFGMPYSGEETRGQEKRPAATNYSARNSWDAPTGGSRRRLRAAAESLALSD